MEQIIAIGKPSYKNLDNENKEAFYKDYVLIQQIIQWKKTNNQKFHVRRYQNEKIQD